MMSDAVQLDDGAKVFQQARLEEYFRPLSSYFRQGRCCGFDGGLHYLLHDAV